MRMPSIYWAIISTHPGRWVSLTQRTVYPQSQSVSLSGLRLKGCQPVRFAVASLCEQAC